MEPPSYDEARLHPPALGTVSMGVSPPPTYHVTLTSPSTPPPTYGEAVTWPTDPYPVLAPPTMHAPVTTPPQRSQNIVHQSTHIGVSDGRPPGQTVPSSSQTVYSLALGEHPSVVQCPYCRHNVTTAVQYKAGRAAWCTCFIFVLLGFVCGCCLIPFCAESMQDVHHSCPQCHKHLCIHTR